MDELLRLREGGAQLLDARDPADFAAAHLLGSVNIGLSGQYASWAGTLLDRERPIVIIAPLSRESEAAMRLGRIGFDHVAGYLEGGIEAVGMRRDLIRRTPRVTAQALAEWLASPDQPVVLDVRGEAERRGASIPGSLHIPLQHLLERLAEVPCGPRTVVVHCASGYRSSIAASVLQRHGVPEIADLVGGITAWSASNLPTV